jgi:enoyl-CoA hydratase/carnithine racemase
VTDGLVRAEMAGGVAILTLNRPEALNAWTPELEGEWNERLDAAVADPAVVAVVVTGAGRGFCAGADAAALARRSVGAEGRPVRSRPLTALLEVPKPVVAAVNGPCVGLGLALALCCDLRFAGESARLSAPFARRGLLAEFRTAELLPALVGRSRANDLLLSGRTVDAAEALSIGLVDRVVPDAELVGAARAWAAEVAATCSPTALAGIKASLALPRRDERAPRLDDFAEGMASLRERRPPRFPGLDAPDPWWSA